MIWELCCATGVVFPAITMDKCQAATVVHFLVEGRG